MMGDDLAFKGLGRDRAGLLSTVLTAAVERRAMTRRSCSSSRISTGGYHRACINQIHYTSTNSGPSSDPGERLRSISQSTYLRSLSFTRLYAGFHATRRTATAGSVSRDTVLCGAILMDVEACILLVFWGLLSQRLGFVTGRWPMASYASCS